MTIPARYLLRMTAFLVVVGVGLFILRDRLLSAFAANPFLNGLILAVLLVGIVFCLWLVARLWRDVGWIRRYQRGHGTAEAGTPRMLAPMATMIGERGNRPLRLTASTMRSILDSVGARLDEGREISRYLIALLVFLGLLGTFWGLIETIEAVASAIQNLTVESGENFKTVFQKFKDDLLTSIGGAGTAFSTSLFGLGGSLIVGFLDLQAGQAQNRFYTGLEDWLSGVTRLSSLPTEFGEDEPESAEAYLQALLEHTAEIMENIQQSLTESERERADTGRNLGALTQELAAIAENMRGEQTLLRNLAEAQVALKPVLDRLAAEQAFGRQEMVQALNAEFRTVGNRLMELNREQRQVVQQTVQESAAAREQMMQELRNEFRILARTLATVSARGGERARQTSFELEETER
ncbi:MAG: flagellar motor protein MotA [Rhodospirillaceae bacterium]|nr:flagellar motor protein MotA [Rhodospirillaceae bacterium]